MCTVFPPAIGSVLSIRKTIRGGAPLPPRRDSSLHCIPQFDGNLSILSENKNENEKIETVINIIFNTRPKKHFWPPWFDAHYKRTHDTPPVRQTIRRDNKISVCQSLPVVSVSNFRSLIPKVNHFVQDILEREIGVAIISEIWEKTKSKKHTFEIEKMLKIHGLKYISTPRIHKRVGELQ